MDVTELTPVPLAHNANLPTGISSAADADALTTTATGESGISHQGPFCTSSPSALRKRDHIPLDAAQDRPSVSAESR